jgi:hypothetical protein
VKKFWNEKKTSQKAEIVRANLCLFLFFSSNKIKCILVCIMKWRKNFSHFPDNVFVHNQFQLQWLHIFIKNSCCFFRCTFITLNNSSLVNKLLLSLNLKSLSVETSAEHLFTFFKRNHWSLRNILDRFFWISRNSFKMQNYWFPVATLFKKIDSLGLDLTTVEVIRVLNLVVE